MKLPPLPPFGPVRVLVVGDVMLDRYCEGQATRISPEAPVPAVRVHREFDRLGGAANVALNVKTLGAQCALLGIVSSDPSGKSVAEMLAAEGIENLLQIDEDGITTQKMRVLARGQQMIRLDFEEKASDMAAKAVETAFETACKYADIVILSDYAKGSLQYCQSMISTATKLGKPVVVDPKGTDFGKYQGATLLTPNLSEFSAVAGECNDEAQISGHAQALCKSLHLKAILVTRSEKGMSLIELNKAANQASSQAHCLHLPTAAKEVFDVTGAGDTVVATLAAALGAGMSLQDATALSNVAAGIAVAKVGTAAVTLKELQEQLATTNKGSSAHKLCSAQQLIDEVAKLKGMGKTVVMTNGCFDILHPGHIEYLERARALGDFLVLALNSDQSVRQLKGEGRPVNPLPTRARMLGALSCVDMVTEFDEETPEALISSVLPSILVKGGDYKVEQIAGAKQVQAAGGQVLVLDFLDGHSTTHLIEKIKGTAS